jgi:hypothetical protein
MLSLLFLGDSARDALDTFKKASAGLTPWGVVDPRYGVTMSEWNGAKYVVTARKGFAA